MKCHVYRSSVKDGLFVFVSAGPDDDGVITDAADPPGLASLPDPVRKQLGTAALSMTLELTPASSLAQENIDDVLDNLSKRGFHIQMPRDIESIVEQIARTQVPAKDG